nr:MAG TPA: hypothetical protein [Herelleviridae sp.]
MVLIFLTRIRVFILFFLVGVSSVLYFYFPLFLIGSCSFLFSLSFFSW